LNYLRPSNVGLKLYQDMPDRPGTKPSELPLARMWD